MKKLREQLASSLRCALLCVAFVTTLFAQIGVFGGTQGGMNATHSGVGAPPASLGVNGDLYIDTTPGAPKLYGPKANGLWPAGISLGGSGTTLCSAASASSLGCLIVPTNSGLTVDSHGNLSVTAGAFLADSGSNGLVARTAPGVTGPAKVADLPAGYSYANLTNTPTLGSAAALPATSLLGDSGSNGIIKRTGPGATAVATAADLPAGYSYSNLTSAPALGTAAALPATNFLSDSGGNGLVKRTAQGTTAVASAADLPTGYPYSSLSNPPALGTAAALSATSLLSDSGANGLVKRTGQGVTAVATAADLPAGYSYSNLTSTPALGTAAALPATSFLSDSGGNGLVKRTAQGTAAVATAADLPAGYPYTSLSNPPSLGTAAALSATSLLSDSGANGLVKRTGPGTTAVATAADLPAGYSYTNLTNTPVLGSAASLLAASLLSDPGANGLVKRTGQGTTGVAGVSDLPAGYSYRSLSNPPTDLGQFTNNQVGYLASGTATASSSLLSISNGTLMADPSDPSMSTFNIGLHNSTTRVVNAVLIGDSWTEGAGFTNFKNIWAQQVQAYLQTNFGSHGSGVISLHTSTGAWTLTGTWNQLTSLGPGQSGASAFGTLYQAAGTSNTAALTTPFYGDHLLIYYATYADSGTGFTVSIDGGSPTTYAAATSTSYTPNTVSIPTSTGWHTAVITAPATGSCYLYGAEWISGTSGVSVHNMAHGGARSEAFGSSPATQMAWLKQIKGGVQMAVISLGVNDYGNSIPLANYQNNLQSIITYLQTNFSPTPSILILDQGNVNEAGASPQSSYAAIEQQLALANNAMFLSVSKRWGSFANASALGVMYTDGIHPVDAGYLDIASLIERRIVESGTPFVQSYGSLSEVVGNPSHNIGNETSSVGVGTGALGTGNFSSIGFNTGVGQNACSNLTTGHNNTCLGQYAGGTGPTTGLFNTLLGSNAQAGNGSSYVVQLGGGTNSVNNTAQYMTWNFLDSYGYMNARLLKLGTVTISTAATVALTYGLTHLIGTIPVSTITPPPISVSGSSFTGCVMIIADNGFSTTTTGNIFAAYSLAAGSLHNACYDSNGKWYIQ